MLWLATGCQGEPRAALTRIAAGQHPTLALEPGDVVIFSSKIIPGNERTLYNLHNALIRGGIEVITEEDHFVHVSGHPCRDEVAQMYRWIKPEIAIPVHGEARHLHEHLAFARGLGVPQQIEVRNGDVVRLAPAPAEVVDEVPTGRLVLENDGLVAAGDDLFRTRRRLMAHGTVLIGLVLDGYGTLLAAPQLSTFGAVDLEREPDLEATVQSAIEDAVEALDDEAALDDEQIRAAVRVAVRRAFKLVREKRPIIEIQITRLDRDGARRAVRRGRSRLMLGRLNHVAIAVPDLDAAVAQYRDRLGAKVSPPAAQAAHGVTTVFVELANTKIELLHPLGAGSPIAAFLERQPNGGIHHLCFEVEDILAARDHLLAQGARRARATARPSPAPTTARSCSCIPRTSAAR